MAHPPCIHFDDVEAQKIDRGELRAKRWRLGAAAGPDCIVHLAGPEAHTLDIGKASCRGIGVIARVDPAGYRDGEA